MKRFVCLSIAVLAAGQGFAAPAGNSQDNTPTRAHSQLATTVTLNVVAPDDPPSSAPLLWEEYERVRICGTNNVKFRQTDPAKVKPVEIRIAIPEAAQKYKVPQELLAALIYAVSDGGHHYAEHDIEGGFGLMMLKESPQCDSLGEAAALLSVSKEELIYDQRLNVLGGAAVLRTYHEDGKAAGLADSEAWYLAVSQYSGRPQPDLAAALAEQVAYIMIDGFECHAEDGSGYYKLAPIAKQNLIFQPKTQLRRRR